MSHLSQTDPSVVEFFKLLLAVLQVLNEGVLDEKNTKKLEIESKERFDGMHSAVLPNDRRMFEAQVLPCPPGQPCVPSNEAAASRWTR